MTQIEAPAKINLFLEVLDLRADGYHNVRLVNQQVSLADRIRIDPAPVGEDRLAAEGPFAESVPREPETNTILRALELMRSEWRSIPALDIRLEKNIPAGAGLGGGSADAAAVAIEVWRRYLAAIPKQDVIDLLAEIGSDMPFAAVGGTALVEGRGDIVTPVGFALESVHYVLASPPVEVSTAWAYRALDEAEDRPQREPGDLCVHLRAGDYDGFAKSVWNAFEAVVFTEYPELGNLVEVLERAGCDAAWMTGSGSNLVGLCRGRDQARSVVASIKGTGEECPLRIIRPFIPSALEKA